MGGLLSRCNAYLKTSDSKLYPILEVQYERLSSLYKSVIIDDIIYNLSKKSNSDPDIGYISDLFSSMIDLDSAEELKFTNAAWDIYFEGRKLLNKTLRELKESMNEFINIFSEDERYYVRGTLMKLAKISSTCNDYIEKSSKYMG